MTSGFATIPFTAQGHFKLRFYGAVLRVRQLLRAIPGAPGLLTLDFLEAYYRELDRVGFDDDGADSIGAWGRELEQWERQAGDQLPLAALRDACALDPLALDLLFAIGLVEEDPRFGLLFDSLQGTVGRFRPAVGLLTGWWAAENDPCDVRAALRQLLGLGVCELVDAEALRSDCGVQLAPEIWDALRGEPVRELGAIGRFVPPDELTRLDEVIAPDELVDAVHGLPRLLADGEIQTVIVRGPTGSGRRTLLGALAAAMGRGVLESHPLRDDAEGWETIGPLATLLNAMPVVELDLAPAETVLIGRPRGLAGPVGVVLGRQGGVSGSVTDASVTFTLGMPDMAARRRHWVYSLGAGAADLDELATQFRMTGGNIRRAARIARASAALEGREEICLRDVRRAGRALGRQALDSLATPVLAEGDWSGLAVDSETLGELRLLERRCRYREQLEGSGAAFANAGVRALFSGPSGAGKTLAASLLAAVLQRDIYRLDNATVVDKYVGETAKNLSRVFDRAEELDVIVLVDEGDSLLTNRTSVQTAHDRYANQETNYLLQRMETFEGILIVTTNAADRIDAAFQRRMDVAVTFRAPDVAERWAIWELHLPPAHEVETWVLEEISVRCALTGGQIKNAVAHATLLALEVDGCVRSSHVDAAVRREYRKAGSTCPLRLARAETYA